MRILIVDDSAAMRAIIRRSLGEIDRAAKAVVEEASGVLEAFDLIRRAVPSLILCDWNMPDLGGLHLLKQLREARIDVPFGFITAEVTPALHEEARAAGARFVLTKPFTPAALERALAGVL